MSGRTRIPRSQRSLAAEAEIAAADEADDRVAPQDQHGNDEDEQQHPLSAAERSTEYAEAVMRASLAGRVRPWALHGSTGCYGPLQPRTCAFV